MTNSLCTRIVKPRSATASLKATAVSKAYNYPAHTGAGRTVAVIELSGAVNAGDLSKLGLNSVETALTDGAKVVSDGPNGADGEVMLDVEVILEVAPHADVVVIFAPNTDQGFYDAFDLAGKRLTKGDSISCSWGGPEDSWDPKTAAKYNTLFAAIRAKGINIFCASGDNGSGDGESGNHVDFPASSPNVVGCGGTRLTVNPDGSRSTEVTWNDDPTSSATGGGDSVLFLGRAVPDVAGNADPVTGYQILVDGQPGVIGGTSAVAPLYAALAVKVAGTIGGPFDFLTLVLANPDICYDVTAGDNGAFRAGPGRDKVTGFGVVDGAKAVAKLGGGVVTPPAPVPAPPVVTPPTDPFAGFPFRPLDVWAGSEKAYWPKVCKTAAQAYRAWRSTHKN